MTVHRIQVMASTDADQQNVKNKISDLKSKYGEKLSKENASFDQGETIDGSVTFYQGTFIVTLSDGSKSTEKNDLMDQVRKEMDKSASWWQLRWHECTHDGDTRINDSGEQVKDCAWETIEKSSSADIPDEVEY